MSETDAERAHRIANQCQVLMGSNDELLEALEAGLRELESIKGLKPAPVVYAKQIISRAIYNAKKT